LNPENKILIVGQGLAGTLLSQQLYKRGIDFHIIDNAHHAASTKVAAGLINPITGRRYIKSWHVDELLPEAILQYRSFEELLDIEIVYQKNILRTLRNPKQINLWDDASTRPGYASYMEESPDNESYKDFVKEPCKFAEVKNAYRINISLLIEKYQIWLKEKEMLTTDIFDFNALEVDTSKVVYKGTAYHAVIFCQGHKSVENPYFKDLGFQLAKGQVLTLKFDDFYADKILRDDIFFASDHNGHYWCGGGYYWTFEDDLPTDEWKLEWEEKIKSITENAYEVVAHEAAIRPCVLDRKPLLGKHPEFENLILFNGLGTKGTSLGPYFAKHLIEYIFDGKTLMPEVDWRRYL